LLSIEHLSVALSTGRGSFKAVDDVSLGIGTGEIVGIAGESGSGKTMTALSLLGPERSVVAVLGPARRRWPRHLSAALGPQATARDRAGLLIAIAADKHLTTRGLDSSALPASLLHAAENLLRHTGARGPDQKGQPT